ncbi:MAG: aminopeptidase P N-terminal domain-containing protein, partial [Rhodocyclaceae bacterium]|nr:aminopeptidase P N-terminal domain-containing protein [Rhodocyclaceae bacterium]
AGGGLAVIPTAPERLRNRDVCYPFRADSHFHYLSGFPEPEAALVLIAGKPCSQILFCRARDAEKETWEGRRYGPKQAAERFLFDAAYPIDELDARLTEWLADQPAVWFPLGADEAWDRRLIGALNAVKRKTRAGQRAPTTIHDVAAVLDEMRLIKDAHEIALMRRAAEIAASAHQRAMRATRPGRYEYEIEAELIYEFRRLGADAPSYPPIVAGGANACILHYTANDQPLRAGDLLLIDAGCEVSGYASDITRTFPISGRFVGEARELYALVLAAQQAALAKVKPGASFLAPHEAAIRTLTQGFVDLGLLAGSVDGLIEIGAYKRYFLHRTSHWLGLDVHDGGHYRTGKEWRMLAPGMALTIEPGCYVRPGRDAPERFWNIGVRIEDDVVVTETGCEVITDSAPKTIAAIEEWMNA